MIWKLPFSLSIFMLFYSLRPVSLNLNSFEKKKKHTNRRNADITGIVYLNLWQFEYEIRPFGLEKLIIQI